MGIDENRRGCVGVCRGVRGTRGPPGTPGSDGVPGVPGNDGRAGLKGEKGDNVINTMAMLLLQKCCKHLQNCRIHAVEYRLSALPTKIYQPYLKVSPLPGEQGWTGPAGPPGPPGLVMGPNAVTRMDSG